MLVEEIKWRLIQALKLQPCWPAYACFPVPNSLNCEYRGIFVSAWWVSQCSYVLSPHAVLLLLSFHRVDPHSDTWSNNQPIIQPPFGQLITSVGFDCIHLTMPHFGSRHGNWSSFQSSEVQPLAISCCFLEEAKYKSKTSKSQSSFF